MERRDLDARIVFASLSILTLLPSMSKFGLLEMRGDVEGGRSLYGVVGWCGLFTEKNGFGAAAGLSVLTRIQRAYKGWWIRSMHAIIITK